MQEQPVLLQPLIEKFGLTRVHEMWLREIGSPATFEPNTVEVLRVLQALEDNIPF